MNYWSERYLRIAPGTAAASLRRSLMLAYYRTRPLAPAIGADLAAPPVRALQARSAFPRWPVETCLHDFFDLMCAILAQVAGEPIPTIAPWPDGYTWALVLTHDVEHDGGLAAPSIRCSSSSERTACARPGTSSRCATRSMLSASSELAPTADSRSGSTDCTTTGAIWSLRDLAGATAGGSRGRRALASGRLSLPGTAPRLGLDAGCSASTTTRHARTPTRSSRSTAAAAPGCRSSTGSSSSCR